jgi:hypothetical protein
MPDAAPTITAVRRLLSCPLNIIPLSASRMLRACQEKRHRRDIHASLA